MFISLRPYPQRRHGGIGVGRREGSRGVEASSQGARVVEVREQSRCESSRGARAVEVRKKSMCERSRGAREVEMREKSRWEMEAMAPLWSTS